MMIEHSTSGPPMLSVSDAARRLNVNPRFISDLFYQRKVDDSLAPVQPSGRRLIPEDQLHVIARELRKAGRLPPIP